MDRISTLRNIEDSLSAYESGEVSLPELEHRVRGILRTYATEFQPDAQPFQARGGAAVDGLVVVATSRTEARERIDALVSEAGSFEVEPLEE